MGALDPQSTQHAMFHVKHCMLRQGSGSILATVCAGKYAVCASNAMFDTLRFLAGFCIAPTVHRAHQVPRYATNAIERHRSKLVVNAHIFTISFQNKTRNNAIRVL